MYDDFYDTEPERSITEEEIFLDPVDIGSWQGYSMFIDEEQKSIQEANLCKIEGLTVTEGTLSLIYTKQMARINEYIESLIKEIKIENVDVSLENEIFHTSKIEGAKTTRIRTTEIHNGAPIDPNNFESEKMIQNGFAATKLLLLSGDTLSKEKITKVWDVLINECCHNESIRGSRGEYRTGNVQVGGHVGLSFENVDEAMSEWLDFYNSNRLDEKPFIKAAILHYSFENIHPFCDGNGRIGRLLMNHYLISRGIDACKAVSFSMEIDRDRSRYDVALSDSENKFADCTPFVEYMLLTMANAFDTAKESQNKA